MKRINLILVVFAIIALAACGSKRDRCPSVGQANTTTTSQNA